MENVCTDKSTVEDFWDIGTFQLVACPGTHSKIEWLNREPNLSTVLSICSLEFRGVAVREAGEVWDQCPSGLSSPCSFRGMRERLRDEGETERWGTTDVIKLLQDRGWETLKCKQNCQIQECEPLDIVINSSKLNVNTFLEGMKPDGVTMETTEPTETAAEAEPSMSQDNITEQAPSQPEQSANDTAPGTGPKVNGKPEAAEPKVKPQAVASKIQAAPKTAGAWGSNPRPGAASHRTMNTGQSSKSNSAKTTSARKTAATTTAKSSSSTTTGAVPKRPVGVAAVSSTVKNQTRVPDKKPVGTARTTSVAAATATNGTKPTTMNGVPKRRTAAETVNASRPKSMVATASRPVSSTAPKPSTSTAAKTEGGAISKTTRGVYTEKLTFSINQMKPFKWRSLITVAHHPYVTGGWRQQENTSWCVLL
ncbi:hypothetical protein PAMP_020872 [Pampus punctatissimus]